MSQHFQAFFYILKTQIESLSFILQISEEQIQNLTEYLHIDSFRKRPNNNNSAKFFRKGKVGDWMNHFKDPIKLAEFDQWITENNSENIPIKYEL